MIPGLFIFSSNSCFLSNFCVLIPVLEARVVMYRCESWTIKKAEHQRIDAFEPWRWRRLLRVLWTARRSNQSILKEINPDIHWKDCCWSWSSNTLATWWEELSHWKRPWCWERLKAGGEGDNREWNDWMASLTQWMNLSKLQEMMKDREAWGAAVHALTKSQLPLRDWKTTRSQRPSSEQDKNPYPILLLFCL